jgi:CheY-like chemotaxis protein
MHTVLLVEDSEDDVLLIRRAFAEARIALDLRVVSSVQKAMDYLTGRGRYQNRDAFPLPTYLLTDLKMPALDGFELLLWVRQHSRCKVIPAIVITNSNHFGDVEKAYEMGANAYHIKPAAFHDLVELVKSICHYWGLALRPRHLGC